MNSILFYDDDDSDRIYFGDWFFSKLHCSVEYMEALPRFETWLAENAQALPCLAILDLYTATSPAPTEDFVRQLKNEPLTRHIPVVLLTNANKFDVGPRAFGELHVDDILSKEEIALHFVSEGRKERVITDTMSALLSARLQSLLRRGRAQQQTSFIQDYLTTTKRKAGYLLIDPFDDSRILYGSADALKFLRNLSEGRNQLGMPAPSTLRIENSTASLLHVDRRLQLRTKTVGSLQAIYLNDTGTEPYLRALWDELRERCFHPDWLTKAIEKMCEGETPRWASQPKQDDAKVLKMIDSYIGYLFALTQTKLMDAGLMKAATTWQQQNLTGSFSNCADKHVLSAMHRGLALQALSDAEQMAMMMRSLVRERPLMESFA